MDKQVNDAMVYATSTNKIEDMNLSKSELEEVKKAILEQKNSESFVSEVVKQKEKEDKNGTTK